mmetsp:Transcript_23353/g.39640  ORF Transcript_23353/g.39640 Transcript_23353/m.39640 type:complete len:154 (-) Transcript_23353:235-696(-)
MELATNARRGVRFSIFGATIMLIAAVCILIHRTKSDAVVERDAASQGEGLFSVVDAYCIQVSRETYRYEVNETFSGRNVEWTSACTCNGGVPDFSNYEAAADEGDDLGDLMAYAAEEGESHTFTGPIVCMDRLGTRRRLPRARRGVDGPRTGG